MGMEEAAHMLSLAVIQSMQQAVEQEQFITMNILDFLMHGKGMEH